MSQQIIRGLLQTRLLTLGWEAQTAFEGKHFTPTADTPYQEVVTSFSEADATTIGGSSLLRGVFQVRLMYPLPDIASDGIGVPWARAEQIQALFHRNLTMAAAGVKVLIAREPQITRGPPQGDRDVTIIRARFRDR